MAMRELQISGATATEHLGRQCVRFEGDHMIVPFNEVPLLAP